MTLFEDFKAALLEDESLTPVGVEDSIENVQMVQDEFDSDGRWSNHFVAVFKRGEEYVALDYQVPATELQEGGDFYSEIYEVEPVKITITRYEKKVDY